jgi:hypothetical protein
MSEPNEPKSYIAGERKNEKNLTGYDDALTSQEYPLLPVRR